MKHTFLILAALSSLSSAQTGGVLTPAAAPGQTMKSLDQVEARTPVIDGAPGVSIDPTTGTVTISQGGSYYLVGNISVDGGNGILVDADGVSLDLNGFYITATTATPSRAGVQINGNDCSVFNGRVLSGVSYDSGAEGDQYLGTGFNDGIYAISNSQNIHIHHISISGCNSRGIDVNYFNNSIVEHCSVNTTGSNGIDANVVRNCVVSKTGGVAISARIVDFCDASSNGADGIYAYNVSNSRGVTLSSSTASEGIYAVYRISNSYGSSTGGDGLEAKLVYNSQGRTTATTATAAGIDAANLVDGCYGESTGGPGIDSYRVSNSQGNSTGNSGSGSTASHGIRAIYSVYNSYGSSSFADGINAESVSYSKGYTNGADTDDDGIEADLAIGCRTYGGENITNKYLMP